MTRGSVWISLAVTFFGILLSTSVRAQSNQTYSGGTNTWDAGTTADWSGATWTANNNAIFNGTSNTVTVNGTVGVNELEFNAGTTTISGGTLDETAHSTSQTDPVFILVGSGSGPVTINSQIELADLGPDQQNFITNNSSSNLTIGSIDFGPYTINPAATGNRRVNLNSDTAGGTITLNGTYTSSAANHSGTININTNVGGVYVTANANFSGMVGGILNNYTGGTEYIDNSTFLPSFSFSETNANGVSNEINLVGSQTIAANLYDSMKNSGTKNPAPDSVSNYGYAHINQSTANVSTWSGYVTQDGSNINLSAVTGGRLNMTGALNNNTPLGLIVSGAGTVVIGNATGNSYNEEDGDGFLLTLNPVAADLQSGTTLITNTSGSAFGATTSSGRNPSNPSANITSNPSIVKLEAGATLGGTGISKQQIVAEAGTSVITAGDPGQSSLGINASIGTLTLAGGLTTTGTNGLTLDFKLDGLGNIAGTDNDLLSVSNLTLNGIVTLNFTSLDGSVVTGEAYTLAYGSGTWSGTPTFDITTPAGYVLDTSYNGTGYDFDTGGDSLSVQFALAPEPSVLAMLGLSLLLLVAAARWLRHGPMAELDESAATEK